MKSKFIFFLFIFYLFSICFLFGVEYDKIWTASEKFIAVKLNGKWGYIDEKSREVVIPLEYDDTYGFIDGVAHVVLNKKHGYIDYEGKEVIPLVYDDAGYFIKGYTIVKLNGKWGVIDKKGEVVVPFIYDKVSFFGEIAEVTIGRKKGLMNYDGKILFPIICSDLNYLALEWEDDKYIANAIIDGKHGYIDKNYKFVPGTTGRLGIFTPDKNGEEIALSKYDYAGYFADGLAPVERNGKWGYIDERGSEVIPLIYDDVGAFTKGYARTKRNGKWGFINKKGKVVIPFICDEIDRFYEGIVLNIDGKKGLINYDGRILFPTVCEEINYPSSIPRYVYVNMKYITNAKIDGKAGYIDRNYRFIPGTINRQGVFVPDKN